MILSLGAAHSFALEEVFRYLHPNTLRETLVQALLQSPIFETRWRWSTTLAIAVPRNRGGGRVPNQLQRMYAEDLLQAAFPDAVACQDNLQGAREVPDHPLVNQALRDALEEAVDLDGVQVFEWPENLDSLFYSPALFREFCLPVMRRAARMIHARGKYMFAHACGRLKALAPLILEAELDCVEGQAHPPIGDWRLDEARALSKRLIVCGGMTAQEQ